jgi:hypothetical protein
VLEGLKSLGEKLTRERMTARTVIAYERPYDCMVLAYDMVVGICRRAGVI